jgi:hypothetical protein
VEYDTMELPDSAAVKVFLQSAQAKATGFYRAIPDLTLTEVKKGQRVKAALDQVLGDPAGAEALQQQPALKPLLDEAAD